MIEEKNLILPKRNLSPITDYYSRNIQTKQWIDMCQQSLILIALSSALYDTIKNFNLNQTVCDSLKSNIHLPLYVNINEKVFLYGMY